ncbi:Glucose-signaling factor 2 [Cyberlindnera fabianii]|uniref:Glucose-signaling factor 2 n=1 Tax=Cyberlindnera fabianii TaxID=36022 RepID=A0A1V2L742_CYBFA|nr:Glucose-signaling factor 2 [Cyberlindnera fabianii]
MSVDDVIDAQDARLEVYMRMNDDSEKDYCFSVGINDTFESLMQVFHTLKLSLRPNAFYHQIPSGFKVSTDPGYLTVYGGLLYTDDATKNTKNVKLTDKISDHAWPGQLIVPVWEPKNSNKFIVLAILAFWLYTDLPDVWSPTPGICLTNQISFIIAAILNKFELKEAALDMIRETAVNRSSFTAQMIFFAFHVFKLTNLMMLREINLIAIGWTGSRKATLEEYKEYFRDTEVKKLGGIVKASKMGMFERLKNPGVILGEGEGFDTPLTDVKSLKQIEANPEKFELTYEYYADIGEYFENYLSTQSKNANTDIKISENMKIVEARKAIGDAKAKEDKKTK